MKRFGTVIHIYTDCMVIRENLPTARQFVVLPSEFKKVGPVKRFERVLFERDSDFMTTVAQKIKKVS